ncbi:MAG TPA: hypothetical protein VF532_09875 [Candidatus Angelobacter sp.]
MKSRSHLVAALLFAAVSTLCAFSQDQVPAAQTEQTQSPHIAADEVTLSPGTFLVAEFNGGLNAGKLKPGDKVKATLTTGLLVHGRVIAPEESRLEGHVTEARAQTSSEPESRLGIIFDKLFLGHHKELRFVATVYLLEPPSNRPTRVDRPSQMLPPSLMGAGSSSNNSPSAANRGNTGAVNRGSTTTTTTPATAIGAMTTGTSPIVVRSTPGGIAGDKNVPAKLPETQSANNPPASAAKGIKPGVYRIKNIALGPRDAQTPGFVIVSKQSTVKLEDGTQVVLMVMNPAPVVASK